MKSDRVTSSKVIAFTLTKFLYHSVQFLANRWVHIGGQHERGLRLSLANIISSLQLASISPLLRHTKLQRNDNI